MPDPLDITELGLLRDVGAQEGRARATTLGELVVRRPAAATLFERLGLDYCCGGRRTLEAACAERGVDAATVAALLDALGDGLATTPVPRHDLEHATLTELCDHIVAAHHDRLRGELPAISERMATVVRVHGATRPELASAQRVLETLRADLETHLGREEERLFPACRALDEHGDASGFDEEVVALLEEEHRATGETLAALRRLCDGYDPATALCGTHRALLAALHELELDLHQHIHEENNVLFPRTRERLTAPR